MWPNPWPMHHRSICWRSSRGWERSISSPGDDSVTALRCSNVTRNASSLTERVWRCISKAVPMFWLASMMTFIDWCFETFTARRISHGIFYHTEEQRERGYELRYHGHHRNMVWCSDGYKIFDFKKDPSNVVVVRVIRNDAEPCTAVGFEARKTEDCIASILAEASSFTIPNAQTGSLLEFYLRIAHLSDVTIELMESDLASSILLTDKSSPAYLTWAQGEQKNNAQPLRETGENVLSTVWEVSSAVISRDLIRRLIHCRHYT